MTCRMKSSNEFRSMPRRVTPEEFMETSEPHSFSLGECKLTITMEFGSNYSLCFPVAWIAFGSTISRAKEPNCCKE